MQEEEEALMRVMTRGMVALALAASAALTVTGASWANTATIGSDLTSVSNSNSCLTGILSNCTALQVSQAGGSTRLPLTSPANGIVTEWAFRSTDEVTYEFRILRPAGGNSYTGAGTALGVDPGMSGDDILRYPTSLPIRQGDAIGIGPIAGDSDVGVPQHDTPGTPSNAWATTTGPPSPAGSPPADGSTATFIPEAGHELLLQATIEFTPGAAGNPTAPTTPSTRPKKKCKKKKKSRSAEVAKKKCKKKKKKR
jgi:hypothetical protein